MDLGEVVEINHPDFAITTPSPPADNATSGYIVGGSTPPESIRGNIRFPYSYILFSKLFLVGLIPHIGGLINLFIYYNQE
jgi:hypothetical protein